MSGNRERNNKVNRAKYRALVRLGQKYPKERDRLIALAMEMEGIYDYDPSNGEFTSETGKAARARVQGKRRPVAVLARHSSHSKLHQGSVPELQQATAAKKDHL